MSLYFLFAKPNDINQIFTEINGTQGITCKLKNDESGIVAESYIEIHTEVYTDVGLIKLIKPKLVNRRYTVMKGLQGYEPLV